jgi:hypothetical protein
MRRHLTKAGASRCYITTFRELAFNRDFYAAAGFAEIAPEHMSERWQP